MKADTTIPRAAIGYYGGKWNIAPWTWEALQREREAERGGDQQSLFVGEAE